MAYAAYYAQIHKENVGLTDFLREQLDEEAGANLYYQHNNHPFLSPSQQRQAAPRPSHSHASKPTPPPSQLDHPLPPVPPPPAAAPSLSPTPSPDSSPPQPFFRTFFRRRSSASRPTSPDPLPGPGSTAPRRPSLFKLLVHPSSAAAAHAAQGSSLEMVTRSQAVVEAYRAQAYAQPTSGTAAAAVEGTERCACGCEERVGPEEEEEERGGGRESPVAGSRCRL
ncbi:hypothetical protein JCM10207_005466 [Rhodosporidiobolus poonsookiae]